MSLVSATVGCVADLQFHIGGLLSILVCLSSVLCLIFNNDVKTRIGLLMLFGFAQGTLFGPLVALGMQVDPAIVFTAVAGTAIVFVCFSATAIYSPKRSFLYLGGMLASATLFMALLSLVSLFTHVSWNHSIQLYFGLAVFCAYVIFDTQLICEKAETGSDDFVWHALELFSDFLSIFLRILVILIENNQKQNKKAQDKKQNKANR